MLFLTMIDDKQNQTAFEKLYHKYQKDVCKRIRKLLKHPQDIEDVMQNTWMAVAENLDFYKEKDENAVKAYILRIAKYQALALYQKRKEETERYTDIDTAELCHEDEAERILLDLCDKMDVSVICESIASLESIYSDVLNYYYLHERSTKEIAQMLNLKEVTVRVRISRGRKKLLSLLEGRISRE